MHKALKARSWTCAKCLRQQRQAQARRFQSTVAAAAASQNSDSHYYAVQDQRNPSHTKDDATLRKAFDSQAFWRDFSKRGFRTEKQAGLIGNHYLTTPKGFQAFAQNTLQKCDALVKKTLAASTVDDYAAIAKDLDRVSDLLCRVIDLSDFIRATHPDPLYVRAATEAYSLMFEYMNVYNTETGLNAQLKKALSMPEVTSQWTNEERAVAEILMKDFAKSGIELPSKQREEFVSLSNEISQVGTDFVNGMEFANDHIALANNQLNGVDPVLVQKLSWWNKAIVPIYSPAARIVMSTAADETARRAIYMADRTASKKSISRLQKLLLKRAELAKLTGYSSFGQMTLVDKMAKTPLAVNNFLTSLNKGNQSPMQQELNSILTAKKGLDSSATSVQPWDRDFYLNRLVQSNANGALRTSKSRLYENISSYFSPGTVIAGLSRLFNHLYGVRFVAVPALEGEVWDPDVRRLNVVTDKDEHIAVIYCDLFARVGKSPNPAHFTLLCSREISDEEIEQCGASGQHPNDGMPIGISVSATTGKTSRHQLPTIALVCDFPEPSSDPSAKPALLSLQSLTTLFHEMGHAVHSILGRTSMQGIAGTRCATDFAELPSILMEYFATDPGVLRLFARHWETDEPIPDEMIQALQKQLKIKAEMTAAWENENQILMALLDQAYHSEGAVQAIQEGRYDSTTVFHKIWSEYGSVREPQGTAWQGFFGHLYGYGATYYAYLFDRAIARQVWRSVFWDGRMSMSTNRDAGERFKTSVLKWGGGRDPWVCLEELMGNGEGILAEGGERAMLEVGKWGVGAGSEVAM